MEEKVKTREKIGLAFLLNLTTNAKRDKNEEKQKKKNLKKCISQKCIKYKQVVGK
jgi:hypothetical protein